MVLLLLYFFEIAVLILGVVLQVIFNLPVAFVLSLPTYQRTSAFNNVLVSQ